MKLVFTLLLISLFSTVSQAKTFNSPFLSFELPPGFSCQNYSGTWNCKKPNSAKNKGTIAITAKKARVGTTLNSYKNRLLKPMVRTWNKQPISSKPQLTDEISIRGQKWIQSTHIDSEIPNTMTKYLITIKHGLSILVSFTAHTDDFPVLSNDFIRSVESLKINNKLKNMTPPQPQTIANTPTGINSGNELDDIFDTDPIENKGGGQLTIGSMKQKGALALLIIGILLFLIARKKRK